jgi:ABC-type uncharacterized transport system substrate-binding protein
MSLMRNGLLSFALVVVATITATSSASAHPHVWVTVHSEVVYGPDGTVKEIRHAWTFDDMFSAYAIQGIAHVKKGEFTRQELSSLAEVNVTSLKEFDYFTYARVNGKKVPLVDPVDYWMEFKDSLLTLHFTLPLKTPVTAKRLQVEIYDPTIFVDFEAGKDAPVALVGAPAGCQLQIDVPHAPTASEQLQLNELDANPFAPSSSFGEMFANKFVVSCP